MSANDARAAVELDVMVTGQVPMPHAYVFRPEGGNRLMNFAAVLRPGGEVMRAPCLAYVIRHPDAGTILVDTGFHPDARVDARKDFGIRMSLVFRGMKHPEAPYEEQLRELGVETAEVERVLMTHLH